MSAAGPPQGTRRPGGERRAAPIGGDPTNSARNQSLLWLAQRTSAAVLALCVVVHLATMIAVTRGGLTAADILGRTRGSAAWAAFYGIFVVAVAIHAPIGLRTILGEWAGARGRGVDRTMALLALALMALGLRAVYAVTA
jgi:fumarate reductase subunit C